MPNISHACDKVRINRSTAYEAREASPEFSAQWDEAIQHGIEYLEQKCWERATVGVKRGIWKQDSDGNPVKVEDIREFSDGLAALLLKAHAPKKYRENIRAEISGPDGGPIPVVDATQKIHPDVLRRIIELADERAANRLGDPGSGAVGEVAAPPE